MCRIGNQVDQKHREACRETIYAMRARGSHFHQEQHIARINAGNGEGKRNASNQGVNLLRVGRGGNCFGVGGCHA